MKTVGLLSLMCMLLAVAAWAQQDDQSKTGANLDASIERVDALQKRLEELNAQSADRAEDPSFFFELGNIYSDLQRREDAFAAFEAALELDPDYVEVLVNIGALKIEIGRVDEAVVHLKKAIKLRPEDPRARVNLGNAFYSRGNYYAAMTEFREAIKIDPNAYEAHYQIAVAFADAGIYREAIRVWQKVMKLAPDTEASKAAEENIRVVEKILEKRL
jgi:tetratricopeptide (TPR) repeat protein